MREFQNGITYTQLITFRAIYESGNIARAAKRLSISAASVSFSLKCLEKQIKAPLFIRTTRAINPTNLGVQLYESSHLAIDDLSAAISFACEQNNVPMGVLSLNMAKNIYDVFLKGILKDFLREFPQIQLEITLSDFMDKHVEKSIDIGFRFGETVNENMIARPITPHFDKVKSALFASPEYLERNGEPKTIADLKKHSLIQFRAPTSQQLLPVVLHSAPQDKSEVTTLSDLTSAMVVNDTTVMIDMACNGLGMGFLMDAMVQDKFDSGELIPLLKKQWCDIPTIYMYFSPENKQSLRVRCFLDFLAARFNSNNV